MTAVDASRDPTEPRATVAADHRDVTEVATALRTALEAAPLPLDLPGAAALRVQRTMTLQQLDDYVLPRLASPDRPLVIVVGGPTGVGKSTLVNTLVGEQVSLSSMIRPTTRSPALVHHPDDRKWFGRDGVLPTFERVERSTQDPGTLHLVASTAVPPGVALLDAPDFDSIDESNRILAPQLLAAADMWLFVTSATRYADELPWAHLEVARQRDTPLLVVMNRIPPEDLETISTDLVEQLDRRGIGRGKIVLVENGTVENGLLQSAQVLGIRRALESMSSSEALRRDIARQCVGGALRQAGVVALQVADATEGQVAAVAALLERADAAYGEVRAALLASLSDGSVLRGDLRTQWNDLVGTEDPLPVGEMVSRVRDRLAGLPPDRQERLVAGVEQALDLALESLVVEHAEAAATTAARRLRETEQGDALLAWSDEDLARPSRQLRRRARQAIARWRRSLASEVATPGVSLVVAICATALPAAAAGADVDVDRASGPVGAAGTALRKVALDLLDRERARYLEPVLGWNLDPAAPARLRTVGSAAAEVGLTSLPGSPATGSR